MKNIILVLLSAFVLVSCGSKEKAESTRTGSEPVNNKAEGTWTSSEAMYINYSFEDVVHLSDVVVLADYLGYEDHDNVREFRFKKEEVICGTMQEEEFELMTFPGIGYIPEKDISFPTGSVKYNENGKYVLIMDRDSSIFYDHDRYQEAGDLLLDVTDGKYVFNGENLAYDSKDEAVNNIKKLFAEVSHEDQIKKEYADAMSEMLDDSDYIAVVQILSDGVKAATHNGTRYECSVETVLKGNKPYAEEGKTTLVLETGVVEKGGTYIIGFNPADRTTAQSSFYVQTTLGTIMKDSPENRNLVTAK